MRASVQSILIVVVVSLVGGSIPSVAAASSVPTDGILLVRVFEDLAIGIETIYDELVAEIEKRRYDAIAALAVKRARRDIAAQAIVLESPGHESGVFPYIRRATGTPYRVVATDVSSRHAARSYNREAIQHLIESSRLDCEKAREASLELRWLCAPSN